MANPSSGTASAKSAAEIRFPAEPGAAKRARALRLAMTLLVGALGAGLAAVALWQLLLSVGSGRDVTFSLLLFLIVLFLFGFAYISSQLGVLSVEEGVLSLDVPVYLGPGRRLRSVPLASIDYVERDPEGSDTTRVRVVLRDSSNFWISGAGPPAWKQELIDSLVAAFPRKV
jgi:hypothetical protein